MASLLIVDDDADGREVLCRFFEKAGHQVSCVSNGKEALSAVLANIPDLVLLDLYMPEMDGAGLLEVLRSYLRLQSLPVIILTALPDSPMVERARHLKVNAILYKGKATYQEILASVEQEVHRVPN